MTRIKLTGNSVAPEENPVRTVDMTPTWEQAARMLLVVLENGSEEGKQMAREEVKRMGILLDSYVSERVAP
jgi:hypothetical protein